VRKTSEAEPHPEALPETPPAFEETATPNGHAATSGAADSEEKRTAKKRRKRKKKRAAEEKKKDQPQNGTYRSDPEHGIFYDVTDPASGEVKSLHLCAPLQSLGLASSEAGTWSHLLEFSDRRNHKRTTLLPCSSYSAVRGELIARQLHDEGLWINPHPQVPALLRSYLMTYQNKKRYMHFSQPGWHENVFLLNGRVFGDASQTPVFQRIDRTSPFTAVGSTEDWNAGIACHAEGNLRMQLAISLAFAAPLMHLVDGEPGVFHFRGPSRLGKSIIQKVAGSAIGGRHTELGYCDSWHMTLNAAENACASHCDLLLCLDELKLVTARYAGELAYMIASGSGKQRMDKSLEAAPMKTWRVLCLSSGEISLETHVRFGDPNEGLYGGMHVRFVEIPEPTSPFGMFDRIPNEFGSAVTFAEELKIRTRRCYGAPIQEYLGQIVAHRDAVANQANEVVRKFVQHTTSASTPSEIVNVAQRFGLATAGGIIAIRHRVLTWNETKYLEGQLALFKEWRQARGSDRPADEDRAVRQTRELVEAHGNRFVGVSTIEPSASSDEDESMNNDDESPAGGFTTHDQLGFRKRMKINGVEETVYLV
jgi:uncharacterized protein (DUF927 family)